MCVRVCVCLARTTTTPFPLVHSSLGGLVCTDPAQATHLVMSRLVRSFKLLAALPCVRHVLHSDWLVDSAAAGHFIDLPAECPPAVADAATPRPPAAYQLDDRTFRDAFGSSLRDIVAAPNRRQLFAGTTFHLTPSVRPTVRDLQQLIELCGGRVERTRRSAARIAEANQQQAGSYVILSCAGDLHLLADLVRPGRVNRAICATEFVMMAILQQRIDAERHVIKHWSV